ncbi:hypothetical protein [Streptomyces griseofuscus]|uniref:hypothetical protein n=1 Tax=Streptomyces griseofuscus TaxID=146922 RepID=UPI003431FAE5
MAALDAEHGGHGSEQGALSEALGLHKSSTTQRVRQRLFALAADHPRRPHGH